MNTFLSRRISATMVLVFGLLFATQLYGATNVTISTAATTNMNYAAGVYTPTTGAATASINVTELQTRLATTNVIVGTTSTGPNTGSITVSNAVTWSSSYGLTLNARGNLSANASISNTGTGAIILFAAQGVDGLLTLSAGCTLTTTGGAVNLTAGTATWKGSLSISGSITSNNGNITIANTSVGADNTNNSGTGVLLTTGTINAGAGNISITGYGQIGGTNCQAIHFGLSGQLITTTGSITVNGTGGSGSSYGSGILFYNGYTVNSTSGIISLTGQGGTGSRNDGIYFFGAGGTTKIYSTSGDINLTAKGGTTGAHAFLTDYPTGNNPTVYIGYDGTTTGTTGNIKFMGDGAAGSYLWRSGGNFKVKGQGNLTMLSNSSAGTLDFTLSGVVQGSAWKKITIGDRYVGGVTLSDNLTNTTSGDSIKVVSKGDITINNPIANNTTGKPVLILAAQGASGALTCTGAITTQNAPITFYAGLNAAGTDLGKTGSIGISQNITSYGGNITIGNSVAGADNQTNSGTGILFNTGNLNAGAGNISITGYGQIGGTNGQAVQFGVSGQLITTTGSITVNGTGGSGSSWSSGILFYNGYTVNSTSGIISLTGQGGTGSRNDGVVFYGAGGTVKIYSTSGDINLTAKGATTGSHAFMTDFPTGNNPTVYIGYDGTTTGTTGNIKFMGDGAAGSYLWRSGGNFKVKGQGNLTMLSNSSAGTVDLSLSQVIQGSAWKKITIGDRYVGGVTLSDNLTNTTSGDSIKVVSKGSITINNPITNNTTGKPVLILAAQGTAGTGLLFTAVPGTLTTANGEIKLRSGVSADGSLISTALGDIVAKGAVSMGATGAQPIDWRASGNMTIFININTSATAAVPISLLAAQGVDGGLTVITGNTLTTAAGAVNLTAGTATRKGSLYILGSITGNNGNITIANTVAGGSSDYGVWLSGGTISAGSGNILVTGYGMLSGGTNADGLDLSGTGIVTTTSGSITLNGTGGSGSIRGAGIMAYNTFTVNSGSGAISLTGRGAGTHLGNGIHFYGTGATTKIYSTSGDINLNGIGGGTQGHAFLTDHTNSVDVNENVYIGYDGTSTGTTGNITFVGDATPGGWKFLYRNTGVFKVKGQGNLIMKSNSSVGSTDLTLSGVIQGTAWKKIKIGDQYIGFVDLSDNLTNTTSGDSIKVASKGDITINNPITNNTTGKPVLLLAAQGAAGVLAVQGTGAVTTTGGDIKLYAGLNAAGTDLAQNGQVSLGKSLTSGGGNISLANSNVSTQSNGLYVVNASAFSVNSGAGNITLNGYAKNSGMGVQLQYVSLLSTTGAINITGTEEGSNGSSNVNCGVFFNNGSGPVTIATTSGPINIVGFSNAADGSGVYGAVSTWNVVNHDTKIYSTSGNILINGTNTTGGTGYPVYFGDTGSKLTYVGYDGTSAPTTGNVTIVGGGASSTYSLGLNKVLVKTLPTGDITIGDNGSALAALTIPNGVIASSNSNSITIGGANTASVINNSALTTGANGIKLTAIGDISGTGTLSAVNDIVTINTSAGTGASGYSGILSGATKLEKTGAGVFKMTAAAQAFTGSTTLKEGTLLLNPSATTATWASPVILDGGILATTGITANTTWTSSATLNLKSASSIVLAPATVHTLTFANSSAESWNTDGYLYVTNWEGAKGASGTAGKIKFTTSPLTAAQLGITLFCYSATTPYSGASITANEVVPTTTLYTFITKKSGNWNDPAVWGLSGMPAGMKNYPYQAPVTINSTDVVALTTDNEICNSLTFNGAGKLDMGSHTFYCNGDLIASNSSALININLGGDLLMQSGSSSTNFAGVFRGSGTIHPFGTYTLTLSGKSVFGGTLNNDAILKSGSNTASLARTNVNNGSTIDLAGYNFSIGALSSSAGGTVTNNGTTDAILTVGTKNSTTTYSGKFTNGGTNKTGLTVVGGVLTLTKYSSITHTGATTITAGELRLNPTSNATGWASPMVLNGGTLGTTGIAASRTWTSTSTLQVTGNSVLALNPSVIHTLTFVNSSAVAWTSGKMLTITGWQGSFNGTTGTKGKLILGASGLTATQLQQIRFSNSADGKCYGATLLASGEVVASSDVVACGEAIASVAPVFNYPQSSYTFTTGAAIAPLNPTVTDGAPIVAYSVSPALPTGLSLNTTTGAIVGTPTAATASATYTVTAANAAGMGDFDISITVNLGEPVITYNTPNTFNVGTAISPPLSPINTGGAPVSYSVSPSLPGGLSLNATTGEISGTPTAITAMGTYTVTATNAAGSGTFGISITVNASVKKLTLKVYLEGLWNGTAMNKCKKWDESLSDVVDAFSDDIADTLSVELHDAATYSSTATYHIRGLDLHQNGSVTSPGLAYINIPTAATGSYFITVKHRNHLETTSAAAVSFSGDVNYDFTDASTKAYVDPDATFTPMKTLNGKWMLYAGYVDKTDSEINMTDYVQIFDNYSDNKGIYGYSVNDLNGDGIVDFLDYILSFNNVMFYFYKE